VTETASEPLPLFKHTARKDWGVGVLIREDDGKRSYLFEDGTERTLANAFHQLMRRVEDPNPEQRAFYERQRILLAARQSASSSGVRITGPTFLDQMETLHRVYTAGLADPHWAENIRGEGVTPRVPRHRDALIREAQEQLSPAAFDALTKTQSSGQIWELIIAIVSRSDLVPAAQLKKAKSVNAEHLRGVVLAAKDLLHGAGAYEPRFEAYLRELALILGEAPRWELATALSAAYNPAEHICVQPTTFRNQLKVIGSSGAIPARATRPVYTRLLNGMKTIVKKLTEHGAPPRDLFDVYDFMRVTISTSTKAKS
jgi:hypothetical protein